MLDPDRFITNYQSTLAKKKYAAAQKPALPNNSFSHSPSITTTGNGWKGQHWAPLVGRIWLFSFLVVNGLFRCILMQWHDVAKGFVQFIFKGFAFLKKV